MSSEVRISINTDPTERLTNLPGIGTKLADRIVQYREDKGYFLGVDDLAEVEGIGEKLARKLEPYIDWRLPVEQITTQPNDISEGNQFEKTFYWRQIVAISVIIGIMAAVASFLDDTMSIQERFSPLATPTINVQDDNPLNDPINYYAFCPDEDYSRTELNVLIATFDQGGGDKQFPESYIFDSLYTSVGNFVSVNRVFISFENSKQAIALGKACGATFVIWGRYDKHGISPHIETVREIYTLCDTTLALLQLKPTASLYSDPDRYITYVVDNLPKTLEYFLNSVSGHIKYNRANYSGAIESFTKALDLDVPEEYRIEPEILHFYRGNSYFELEKYSEAVEDWKSSVIINPSFADAFR